MPPTELLQLIRTCSIHFVFEELCFLYETDHSFYEKLVNLFTRAKTKKDKLTKPT